MIYFQLYIISVLITFLLYAHVKRQKHNFISNWGKFDFFHALMISFMSVFGVFVMLKQAGKINALFEERSWSDIKFWWSIRFQLRRAIINTKWAFYKARVSHNAGLGVKAIKEWWGKVKGWLSKKAKKDVDSFSINIKSVSEESFAEFIERVRPSWPDPPITNKKTNNEGVTGEEITMTIMDDPMDAEGNLIDVTEMREFGYEKKKE